MAATELPILQFATAAAWDTWLDENGSSDHAGAWLLIAKKGSGVTTVTYAETVEAALCHGWIDGQKARHDDVFYKQRFTPRRKRSIWSQVNRTKALELIEAGRMKAGGFAAIEAAKSDGRWEAAYESQGTMTVPPDLAAALAQNPEAKTTFDAASRANRYALCFRLQTTRSAEARSRRLAQFVAMLERGELLHPGG